MMRVTYNRVFVGLMIITGFLLGPLVLSGCSRIPALIGQGATANDSAVQAAEFTICNAASIGSIRRAYGDRPDTWVRLCSRDDEFSLPEGNNE